MIELTDSRIDVQRVIDSVARPDSGAIDVFIGSTRNRSGDRSVLALEYEAFPAMATKVMRGLEQEAKSKWPLGEVAIIHRTGRVGVGEPSVVIAVSSAHRKEAFEACRFLIDRLKQEVPIWKREYFADGSVEWSGRVPQESGQSKP